jgi:hypothetical protein
MIGLHAELTQKGHHRGDVAHLRHVADLERLGAEQGGGDLGQGGVFRPAHLDRAVQPVAAADDQPVH